MDISKNLTEWILTLDSENQKKFWRTYAKLTQGRKSAQITALLRKGRSLGYNLTEAIGFIMEFFRILLGADHALHIFEKPGAEEGHLLYYWRPAWRKFERGQIWDLEREKKTREENRLDIAESDLPWRESNPCPQLLRPNFENEDECIEHHPINRTSQQYTLLERLREIRKEAEKAKATAVQASMGISCPIRETTAGIFLNEVVLIRLTTRHKDFGTIIIPVKPKPEINKGFLNSIAGMAVTFSRIMDTILSTQYDFPTQQSSLYLPLYRQVSRRRVAILFADIRNFTQLAQILRLMRKPRALNTLLDFYCLIMARIIQQWGRLDKFMGDGIMAIFGENLSDMDGKKK